MQAEIITIGDELLIGQVIDTNSAWMAGKLNEAGIAVTRITSAGDRREEILSALEEAGKRAKIILITGGIGPTPDDITKETLAAYFGCRMVVNEKILKEIEKFLKSRSIPMNEQNRKQAEVPEKAELLSNQYGTAAGMWFEEQDTVFVSMPGVPHEMKALMEHEIIPRLKTRYHLPPILHRTILTYGTFEARLAEILSDFEKALHPSVKLAYLPSNGIIRLRLTLHGSDEKEMKRILDRETDRLYQIIPQYIFGTEDDSLEEIVGILLKKKKATLSIAESCTGGNLSRRITSVPGSSAYFTGSVVAYSNDIKLNVLKINPKSLEDHGSVSREVVEDMAAGVREYFKTDYSIATSGIAGPDGGTAEKPVGLVWIAVASKEKLLSRKFLFGGNRERNIERASLAGLNMLRKVLLKANG
jgi:nicotinamide-nucleotide amidase